MVRMRSSSAAPAAFGCSTTQAPRALRGNRSSSEGLKGLNAPCRNASIADAGVSPRATSRQAPLSGAYALACTRDSSRQNTSTTANGHLCNWQALRTASPDTSLPPIHEVILRFRFFFGFGIAAIGRLSDGLLLL